MQRDKCRHLEFHSCYAWLTTDSSTDWTYTVFCSYDIVQNNQRGFQDDIKKRLIGLVVLTRYNNKTYRIDDISFDRTPQSTFQMADGTAVSFSDYYK